MVQIVLFLLGACLVLLVLWEAFNVVILPRRIVGRVPIAVNFYRLSWNLWRFIARRMQNNAGQESASNRDNLLSFFGPLALLVLLVIWAALLIVGFALMQAGIGYTGLQGPDGSNPNLLTTMYFSGITLFTIGFGDIHPVSGAARMLAVLEGGTGFGFLALMITYIPVFYQSFSRREATITILDARAGSPPTACEFMARTRLYFNPDLLQQSMAEWEVWAAEVLESQLSYPTLMWFRSQHEHQSWVTTLTMMLDTCALVLAGVEGVPKEQARLTFAMARHTAVDLSQVLDIEPVAPQPSRLSLPRLQAIQTALARHGVILDDSPQAEAHLAKLRHMYEPYVNALADYLLMPLPSWLPDEATFDAWSTTPYDKPVTLADLDPSDEPETVTP